MFTMMAQRIVRPSGTKRPIKRSKPPNNLEAADDVNVAAGKKGVQIFAGHTLRERRHRKEMQERIRTKDNENEPEKNAGDNGENSHDGDGKLI